MKTAAEKRWIFWITSIRLDPVALGPLGTCFFCFFFRFVRLLAKDVKIQQVFFAEIDPKTAKVIPSRSLTYSPWNHFSGAMLNFGGERYLETFGENWGFMPNNSAVVPLAIHEKPKDTFPTFHFVRCVLCLIWFYFVVLELMNIKKMLLVAVFFASKLFNILSWWSTRCNDLWCFAGGTCTMSVHDWLCKSFASILLPRGRINWWWCSWW